MMDPRTTGEWQVPAGQVRPTAERALSHPVVQWVVTGLLGIVLTMTVWLWHQERNRNETQDARLLEVEKFMAADRERQETYEERYQQYLQKEAKAEARREQRYQRYLQQTGQTESP